MPSRSAKANPKLATPASKTTPATPFGVALAEYGREVTAKFSVSADFNPEDQLKGPVAALVALAAKERKLEVATITEVQEKEVSGRPDMGVAVRKLLTGHIELKQPGKGADPTRFKGADKKQWEKFKDLPNLMYTDGQSWALYRSGELVGAPVRLRGDVTRDGAGMATDADATGLENILTEFLLWEPIVPSNPRALARLLAPLCRLLRAEVQAAVEEKGGALESLASDWKAYLFPDATDDEFADAYAQTLTYALLLARLSGAADLSITAAAKAIRTGHRLLADTLKILGDDSARDQLKTPVELIERVISAVDVAKLTKRSAGDPWLYFYEDFLAEYDPKMRSDRGVYYTPVQVVRCQVRLVRQLLETRFDADEGFVSAKVVTLDPAAGTGTYLLTAITESLDAVQAQKGEGMRASAVTTAAKNVHAFELLVGPYAVAHLRLTQQVLAEGGSVPTDGVHVYLTDTLESPHAIPPDHLPLAYKTLGEEHKRAQKVKENTPVLVCIGNPPYDREERENIADKSRRKGGWVRYGDPEHTEEAILNDFIKPLVAVGKGVHAKNLYNDYVYFWRWALWKVFESTPSPGSGIVSFITASSYLRGPGYAGMREVMRRTFDDLWIIDLEGGNLGARKTSNVFAIQTPVAIAVGVRYKTPEPNRPAQVHYAKITGTTDAKLDRLDAITDFKDLSWLACATDWDSPFLPIGSGPFYSWPLLTDLFPWQESGMQFKRSWPISEDADVLARRWRELLKSPRKADLFKESRDRKVDKQYKALVGVSEKDTSIATTPADSPLPKIGKIAYRSFDRQSAILDSRVGDYLRPSLHHIHSEHQAYLTSLLTEVLGEGPSAVATNLIPDLHHFRGSFGGAHVIPLWRDAAGKQPNVTTGLLEALSARLGVKVQAEDLFAYSYAILASDNYVRSFWSELEQPGPRIPITTDREVFQRGVNLGRELLWVHTFGQRFIPPGEKKGRVPKGTAMSKKGTPTSAAKYPEKYRYEPETEQLHVGEGIFSGVRPSVYEFSVSGLNVVQSWLEHRMRNRSGKKSSALDDLRPEAWTFDEELLDLLWVLDRTVDRQSQLKQLLADILASTLIPAADLPAPSAADRAAPGPIGAVDQVDAFGA